MKDRLLVVFLIVAAMFAMTIIVGLTSLHAQCSAPVDLGVDNKSEVDKPLSNIPGVSIPSAASTWTGTTSGPSVATSTDAASGTTSGQKSKTGTEKAQ
ncbi:MAG: hypothetical protein A4E57_00554 [Syntrophorhabdaceae bacterium PtaU1.Bin034]|jgi:hypothetical protein|nr:MAG: hypothetical protein A4E57_00554 [Syntrophorhabdaceae bacterium PtaU1.Bin034]